MLGASRTSESSAWASGSLSNTLSMRRFLLPSANTKARYWYDWNPEELPRNPRNWAYSVGVSVARSDHCSVSVRWMCLTRAMPLRAGASWSVLATLTPTEYAQFRGFLGNSSGFQSYQYRAVEFALGNKNRRMLSVFESDPDAHALLSEVLDAPSIYDEFLRYLHRAGFEIPAAVLERDVTESWVLHPELVQAFRGIYENAAEHWAAYEACEELVDLEDNFQLWRFRHLKTVQRIIGLKHGTGGSSGAAFLQKALELTFFPELFAVRTEIGA